MSNQPIVLLRHACSALEERLRELDREEDALTHIHDSDGLDKALARVPELAAERFEINAKKAFLARAESRELDLARAWIPNT